MEIKLELPWSDFKELVKELNEMGTEKCTGFGRRFRKHKVENGRYYISAVTEEAYDHDLQKLTRKGKVCIKIKSENN